jgi:hypothetical protein
LELAQQVDCFLVDTLVAADFYCLPTPYCARQAGRSTGMQDMEETHRSSVDDKTIN